MKRIRVLVCEMPGLLRSIVADALAKQTDMELLGPAQAAEARRLVGRSTVDVVIAAAVNPVEQTPAERLLLDWPGSRVLMITTSGQDAVLYELRPHRITLGEVSPAGLVNAIRAVCCHDAVTFLNQKPS